MCVCLVLGNFEFQATAAHSAQQQRVEGCTQRQAKSQQDLFSLLSEYATPSSRVSIQQNASAILPRPRHGFCARPKSVLLGSRPLFRSVLLLSLVCRRSPLSTVAASRQGTTVWSTERNRRENPQPTVHFPLVCRCVVLCYSSQMCVTCSAQDCSTAVTAFDSAVAFLCSDVSDSGWTLFKLLAMPRNSELCISAPRILHRLVLLLAQ